MDESESRQATFLGTYFDRDVVLKVSHWAEILSWVVVGVYAFDLLLALGVQVLQIARGFWQNVGVTDVLTNLVFLIERPFRGVVYFVALQGIAKVLLILMDMEESLRRAARR
ncbi:MAG: hypothetical protein ACM3QS_06495 [Bacteroidota bacterium]